MSEKKAERRCCCFEDHPEFCKSPKSSPSTQHRCMKATIGVQYGEPPGIYHHLLKGALFSTEAVFRTRGTPVQLGRERAGGGSPGPR